MLHLITCHGRIMPRLAELFFSSVENNHNMKLLVTWTCRAMRCVDFRRNSNKRSTFSSNFTLKPMKTISYPRSLTNVF